jgi:hypothetical protein
MEAAMKRCTVSMISEDGKTRTNRLEEFLDLLR